MSKFKVNIANCKGEADKLPQVQKSLTDLQVQIDTVIKNLNTDSLRVHVTSKLQRMSQDVGALSEHIQVLHTSLTEILDCYEKTESGLTGGLETEKKNNDSASSKENDTPGGYSVDSIVFDDDGSYGGDQGNMNQVYKWDPIRCWELLDYLREYYPKMSIFKAFGYFSHLNNVGCGYVALANSIFLEYEGRPDEFERVFGYPMFNHGDLNYDRLILDIYATTDLDGINDGSDGLPKGTSDSRRAEIVENFLADKGVTVQTEANVDVTTENFQSIAEDGNYVILGYRNGNMYDENGNAHYIDGGHAIIVTGVTDDGRFIVSSWGEKYYINPTDIGDDDTFMTFQYNS